jgi:hypothetical protein
MRELNPRTGKPSTWRTWQRRAKARGLIVRNITEEEARWLRHLPCSRRGKTFDENAFLADAARLYAAGFKKKTAIAREIVKLPKWRRMSVRSAQNYLTRFDAVKSS